MKLIAFLLSAALAAPATAAEADDPMAGYFGNTLISKTPLGEGRFHYKPDHHFDGSAHNDVGAMDLSGTWAIDDKGRLCRTYDTPPPGVSNPSCSPLAPHKVGDAWTVTVAGQTISNRLVASVQ